MKDGRRVEFNATNDRMFKLIFGYADALSELLSAILGTKIKEKDIVFEKTEEEDENLLDVVTPRFDIKIKLFSDTSLIMEMQKHKREYDIMDRLLYYAARQYCSTIKKGSNYAKKKSVVICFTGFTIDNKERCIDTFTFRNENGYVVDGIKIITIAYKNIENCENEAIKKWLRLITTNDFATYEESGDILKKTAKRIQEFNEDEIFFGKMLADEIAYLDKMSQEAAIKEKIEIAEARRKKAIAQTKEAETKRKEEETKRKEEEAKRNEEEAKRKEEEAKRKEEETKRKELEKQRNEAIVSMIKSGLDKDFVSKIYHLTVEEIEKIIKFN